MHKHSTINTPTGHTIISVTCEDCGGVTKQLEVQTENYDRWNRGMVIQRAMPEIPQDDRELLISGTCGPCFDKLFPPEAM